MWRMYYVLGILLVIAFVFKFPKIEHIQFRFFSRFQIDHVLFLETPHLFIFEDFEMP